MTFFHGSVDFLRGKRSAHMGSHQYVDHAGLREGRSVSGAKLWAEIEANELKSTDPNLISSEEKLLRTVSREIHRFIPEGAAILEMGTGTPNAFLKKTLLIMMALRSTDYICVDESQAFLSDLVSSQALARFKVKPILDDFFDSDTSYFDDEDRSALICMFGSTIGNIVAPLSKYKPEEALVSHLYSMAQKICDGWLLVSFDSNQNGEEIRSYYNNHTFFHLNVFDRMAVELPIIGDFDPCAFSYEPLWIASSGQLAHMAVVQRDMDFTMGRERVSLKKGQALHLKNSFKFSPSFFSWCCLRAGLAVVKMWADPSGAHVCLLKKQASAMRLPITQPRVVNL